MVEPFDNIINQLKDSPHLDYVKKNPWVTTAGVVAAATLAKTGVNLLSKFQQAPQDSSIFSSSLFKMFQKPQETSIGGKFSQIAAPAVALATMGAVYAMSQKQQKTGLDAIQNAAKKATEVVTPSQSLSPSFIHVPKYDMTLPKSIRDTIDKGVYRAGQWGGFAKDVGQKMWMPLSVASAIATPFLPMPWKFATMAPWAWNAYTQTTTPKLARIVIE